MADYTVVIDLLVNIWRIDTNDWYPPIRELDCIAVDNPGIGRCKPCLRRFGNRLFILCDRIDCDDYERRAHHPSLKRRRSGKELHMLRTSHAKLWRTEPRYLALLITDKHCDRRAG